MKSFSLFLGLLSMVLPLWAQRVAVDGFAATVNGRIITAGDVLEATQSPRREAVRRYSGSEREEALIRIYDQGLERLIENRLVLEAFKDMDGTLPDGAVRERMDTILRERFDNNRANLLATLRRAGKSEREWENELRDQVIIQQMTQQFVTRRIHMTPRMLRERFEERREAFRTPVELHLLVIALRPVPADELEERKAFLQQLREEILDGADFRETARRVSRGSNAAGGGDQGWVNPASLPAALQEALSHLSPGDISEPVITPTQHFLFKVEDKRGGDPKPLSAVQRELESELRREEFDRLHRKWIEGLRRRFPVVRFDTNREALLGDS